MDLPALIHLVSAIRESGDNRKLVLFGSASVLASYPDLGEDENSMVRRSRDADFILDPWDDDLAKKIHLRVGARHSFDVEYGYYADIIRPMAYENFPPGWESRAIPLPGCPGVICLEPHDMAVAKCFPARPKDRALIIALLRVGRLQAPVIQERLGSMPLTEAWIVKSHRFLSETAAEAGFFLPF